MKASSPIVFYGWNYGSPVYHWITDLRSERERRLAICGREVRSVASDGNYGRVPCRRCQAARGTP